MYKINPMLLGDGYKMSHADLYEQDGQKIYATWTPRKSRIEGIDKVVVFGLQSFVKEWLIDYFNEEFFNKDVELIIKDYKRQINAYLNSEGLGEDRIRSLHILGFLPLKIDALEEGLECPIKVPMFTIENTLPEFFWLTNFMESFMSAELWSAMTTASISKKYREILDNWAEKTCDDNSHVDYQGHDFSLRGMNTVKASLASSAGHLLNFKGSDSVPTIGWLEKYYNADITTENFSSSVPACYDDRTEILTENGWKLFKDLVKNSEKVAYYDEDKTVKFIIPSQYYECPYNGKMIHFQKRGYKYIDLMVTPNHKMVRLLKDGSINLFEASSNKLSYNESSKLIVSGGGRGGSIFTALDKLKVAFQADGSYPSHKEDYTGEKTGCYSIRFSLKKDRKKERLENILNELGYKYTLSKYDNGYYSFWINSKVKMSKDLKWVDIANMSEEYAKEFIKELQYWDGKCKKNIIAYSSINKENIDIVQAVASLANYKSHYYSYKDKRDDCNRKILHSLTITLNKNSISGAKTYKEDIDYNGIVYCVSVPSKMLIVRRNNIVAICGNTEHSIQCFNSVGKEKDEYDSFKRIITEIHSNGLVSIVSDTWNLWHVLTDTIPRLKGEILSRDGKIILRPDSGTPEDIICGELNTQFHPIHGAEIITQTLKGDYAEERSKGVIELLWDIFGGTINSKGYKVLDSHIGAIYGDAITLERAEEICRRLEAKGFASSNIVFGIGSFTYQYNTRDTFGFALKSTYAIKDNKEVFLFKDPITDDGTKKSQKGLVAVIRDNGELKLVDHLLQKDKDNIKDDLLKPLFLNGKLLRETSLSDIKAKLKGETKEDFYKLLDSCY